MRLAALCAVALGLSACASTGRLFSYGDHQAAALFIAPTGERLSVYVHPTDDVLLFQPRLGAGFLATGKEPIYAWRTAAEAFVKPAGCGISTVKLVAAGSWEAAYVCPAGVDLRRLIASQRAQLQQGVALQR